jgi:hypothetical protein
MLVFCKIYGVRRLPTVFFRANGTYIIKAKSTSMYFKKNAVLKVSAC